MHDNLQASEKQKEDYLLRELERLQTLKGSLCEISEIQEKCKGMILGYSASGECAANAAILALQRGKPFSLVRLGDGEGNLLGCADAQLDPNFELYFFNLIFKFQTGVALTKKDCIGFARQLKVAAIESNILGIRLLSSWHVDDWPYGSQLAAARKAIETSDYRGAHGILRSIDKVNLWLRSGDLQNSQLTNAWVYMPLLAHMESLIRAASRTILITGRQEIFEAFSSKYASCPMELLSVPLEPHLICRRSESKHFPDTFQWVLLQLGELKPGTFVLVGAGIFGKIYCHEAKRKGAVAIDVGSGFDILAGIKSRPAHWPELVDQFRVV